LLPGLALGYLLGRGVPAGTAGCREARPGAENRRLLDELSEVGSHFARRWERERLETEDEELWAARRAAWHAERTEALGAVCAGSGAGPPHYLGPADRAGAPPVGPPCPGE